MYKHIQAWGKMMGSFPYYIQDQIERAKRENAPIDAIYRSSARWHTVADISNPNTLDQLTKAVDKL